MQEQRHHWTIQALPAEIRRHIELLRWADTLVLQFPFWWFGAPAILKGWMDRVFVYGGVYDSRHRHENGVMRGKRALLTVTAGASASGLRAGRARRRYAADAVADHACAALYRL